MKFANTFVLMALASFFIIICLYGGTMVVCDYERAATMKVFKNNEILLVARRLAKEA